MAKKQVKNYSPEKLELLILIIPKIKSDFYIDYLQNFEINSELIVQGMGTASNEILSELGISDKEKGVILGVIKSSKIKDCFEGLENKFNSIKNGKGVAWTIPIDSVIGVLIYRFLSNNRTI